jgi:hypothetical protein
VQRQQVLGLTRERQDFPFHVAALPDSGDANAAPGERKKSIRFKALQVLHFASEFMMRYRYYVSTALITGSRSEHPKGRRIPAGDIKGLVLDRLRALFASGAEVSEAVAPLGLDASTQRSVLDRSAKLAERWTTLASLGLRELVQSLV